MAPKASQLQGGAVWDVKALLTLCSIYCRELLDIIFKG